MAIQSDNPPDIFTLEEWQGLNQQTRRASIGDQEEWWNENFFAVGPGHLRTCWGRGPAIYTAPPGTTIVRMFFGYIGTGSGPEGFPPPAPEFLGPPPGQLGWMFLSDGSIDEVDLASGFVSPLRSICLTLPGGSSVWQSVAPNYWASAKVWRPQWVGNSIGEVGGVVFGSPGGLYAWDGTVLTAPGQLAPRWLTNEAMGEQNTPMPVGLPGIYCMEVFQERLFVAGKDVISFSAPSNGADFSTIHGGGSFGYFGDRLVYSFMDLAASAGYLYCYGDSSTDMINNIQMTGKGTPEDPALTNFNYANVDPQVGQRFPRPVGRWGRYFVMFNGAGIFNMVGGDAQVIGEKVTNVWNTLDASTFYPTMAPATIFGFRVMLVNGRFTDPWGVTRSLLLMWHGKLRGKDFWSVASQGLNLTQIGSYEQDSVITPYGTDGTSLYKLFAAPDPNLTKRLSTKLYRGKDAQSLTLKNYKRVFAEITDESGLGVSITGQVLTRGGGVPAGTQDIGFEVPKGTQEHGYTVAPAPISGSGLGAALDLQSNSPDFTLQRLHVAAEDRTLWGA